MPDIKVKAAFNRAVQENTVVESDAVLTALLEDNPETAQIATVTLTAAQVKALFTTPITLVAAPGAGKVIVVDRVFGESVGVTAPFDASTNTLEVKYSGGANVAAAFPNTFIEAAAGSTVYGTVGGIEAALVPVANTAIVAQITNADPAADTAAGTITLTVVYRVFS